MVQELLMAADVYTYINSTGLIETDAATIQNEVSAEYQAAFGTDLVVPDVNNPQASSTPQGLLINAETQARIAVADNNAALANQINPNVAGGIFLDAILALTGASRDPATQSVVYATLAGTIGTTIPAGSLVSETASGQAYQYYLVNAVTLIDNGMGGGIATNAQFNSVLYGAIPCAANSLTTIISNVIGWDSVGYNFAPNPLGTPVQSDASARQDRLVELGIQGNSLAGAVIGAVNAVLGAELGTGQSVFFQENYTAGTLTINGVSMVSHSIYVAVSSASALVNGSQSTVTVTLTGTNTTSVPAGFLLSETASGFAYQFYLVTTTVIGASPTPAIFQSVYNAPIPAPAGSLTTIVNPLVGLASVTNANAATLGTTSNVALAIVGAKSAGAAYNNGSGTPIQALVIVPYSNQQMVVLYDTATPVPILVSITVKLVTPVNDPTVSIQNAILNYVNGGISGEAGLTVGQAVSSFELAGAVTNTYPGIYVQSCLIAKSPTTPTSSVELSIEVYEIATIAMNAITVIFES